MAGELENNVEGPAVAADTIKVLVATDVHLGYLENDPERGADSFVAFEEVLATAGECGADLVLLAGDLFHVARPSPASLLRATRALREHCIGDKPVQLELLSDAKEAFQRSVNYEDPDLNVSVPVVTIHGNHDDPVGQGAVSSLDILSSMGLVNYLGRWSDYTHVSLAPVLFRKGETRLALYGLGHLKDQRLSRLFKEGKVEMQRPPGDDWFNLFALHQNRVDRGPGNYIQEEVLPDFLDLVIWGHEHDCRVHEEQNRSKKFFVSQPGSTVATSLAAGEALPKHMALLQIHKKKFMLTPIPLKTVRPFIFKTIVLSEENLGDETVNENEKVQEFLEVKVNEAVEEAARLRSGHPKQPTLPLVRLNVLFERDSQDFNRVRFGQKFSGVVANPHDLLVMKRERRVRERKPAPDADEEEAQAAALAAAGADAADVEMLMHSYYAALPEERRGAALSARAMTDAVRAYTSKGDKDAFHAVLRATRKRALDALRAAGAETEAEVSALLRSCRLELDDADQERLAGLVKTAAAAPQPQPKTPIVLAKRIVIVSSDDDMPVATTARGKGARGRGRGRGRGRASGAAAAAAQPASPPSPSPTRRNTPRRSAAKRSASWLQNIITDKTEIVDDSD